MTMLAQEARLVSQFSHPNVVSILDFDHDTEQRPYLVMEYVDGINLAKLIATGPLPHPVAIFIVRELLSGLGYIHEARDRGPGRVGLVHCDVTPRNVLLSWEGEVKLTDFGVAQVLEGAMTMGENAGLGTPGYTSPELARCEELDGRSDLFAVGIVLWEILALHRLRPGLPGDVAAAIAFHLIRRPSEYQAGIPVDLEAVAMRLLAYDRDERYRTAEFAAHDLMRCQDVPRDGRAELARLLDDRFPRPHRQGPLTRPPEAPSKSQRTVTGRGALMNAPPWPMAQQNDAAMLERAQRRRRRRRLGYVVLFTLLLALAATVALLVAR
jgi:serine/threonine protein kinase